MEIGERMKKIKIFIGSSIDDLAYERRDLVSFIAELNNHYIDKGIYLEPYICEEKSNEMRPEGLQKVHNDYIEHDADATVFMFNQKAGKYTLKELEIARASLKDNSRKLRIFIYFKATDNEIANTEEIKQAVDLIAGEYAHYYRKFSSTDTVKLELLQYLSKILGKNAIVTVSDGQVYSGGVEVRDISLFNLLAYQNNQELSILRVEIQNLQTKIEQCIREKTWEKFSALAKQRDEKYANYNELLKKVFQILQQLFEETFSNSPNPLRLQALTLLEAGKYREAQELISPEYLAERTNEVIYKKSLADAKMRAEAKDIICSALTRIQALELTSSFDAIEQTYDTIIDLAKIAKSVKYLIEYADFLISMEKPEKALHIAQYAESVLSDDVCADLYTQYDIFNLLSELSTDTKTQVDYREKAVESLFSYIDNLDVEDYRAYAEACQRLGEIVDPVLAVPYLKKAIGLLENHPEEKYRMARLYEQVADALEESAISDKRRFFEKAIAIYEEKTEGADYILHKIIEYVQIIKENRIKCSEIQPWFDKQTMRSWLDLTHAYEKLYRIAPESCEASYALNNFWLGLMLLCNGNQQGIRDMREAITILKKYPEVLGEDLSRFMGIVE